jgi:nucleoside-diphosphate-sugar epimerase
VTTIAADTSMIVANAKAKAELGWKPKFPTYREGIAAASAEGHTSGPAAAA